ncbi:MAG: TolC family protein [Chlorobiaceae bacterium]|nr:TolC family protein [Chlorobiaceae bacterium]NTV61366.1 TolC family protein [Chlorobiaceae bacterium]
MKKNRSLSFLAALAFLAAQLPAAANALEAPSGPITVEEAIRLTRENNPQMKQAAEGLNAADARVTESRSGFFPQVKFSTGYRYIDPVSEMEFSGTAMKFMPNDNFDAKVNAEMMLFDFGRTANQVDIAKSGRKSAGCELDMTGRDLSYASVRTFYGIIFLREAVSVQQREITALRKSLDYARRLYNEGAATRFDVLSIEVRVSAAQNRKTDLETDLRNTETSFRRLTGIGPGTPLDLKGEFAFSPSGYELESLTASALSRRVELELAKEKELSAKYTKSLAAKERLPKIVGMAAFGYTNGYLTPPVPDINEIRRNYAAGVELQLPIFTGFRTSAQNREAKAMMRAAEEQRIDTEQGIREEVEQTLNSLKASIGKIGTTDLQVSQAKLAAEHARIRYQNGLATPLDLLDSEAALAEAELGHLQALYACTINSYALKRAAGDQFRQ